MSLLIRKKSHRFQHNQKVYFTGGIGTIKGCYFDLGKWFYTIEMPLGVEPEMGRVGAETQIILEEIEVQGIDFS